MNLFDPPKGEIKLAFYKHFDRCEGDSIEGLI